MNNTNHAKVALVTGASGFIGSHLVQQLIAEGWRVNVLLRENSALPDFIKEYSEIVQHIYTGATEDLIRIIAESKPTVVYHLASLFLSEHQSKDINELVNSNILLGCQILEAMKVNKVRLFVNTGTSWQHYDNKDYSPVNLYASTKQAFEDILQFYVESGFINAITLQLCDTYGLHDPRRKLIRLLKEVATTMQPLGMSAGEQWIDLVHVDDVVQAYIKSAERLIGDFVSQQEVYAVSSGKPVQIRELVKVIENEIHHALPINWGERPYRDREVMKPWKSNLLPGWQAQISLEEGMYTIFSKKNNVDEIS